MSETVTEGMLNAAGRVIYGDVWPTCNPDLMRRAITAALASRKEGPVAAADDETWRTASFCAFEVYERRLKQGETATAEQRVKVIDEALQHAVGILSLASRPSPHRGNETITEEMIGEAITAYKNCEGNIEQAMRAAITAALACRPSPDRGEVVEELLAVVSRMVTQADDLARSLGLDRIYETDDSLIADARAAIAKAERSLHPGETKCTCGQSGHGNAHEPGCPLSDYRPVKSERQVHAGEDHLGGKEVAATLDRDRRQTVVVEWGARCFGADHMADKTVRAARFFEEAAELVQAVGLPRDHAMRAFDHVYGRAPGNIEQEAGGVGVTLMALCNAVGLSADGCENKEIARCLSKSPETFAERNKAKIEQVDSATRPTAPAPEGWRTMENLKNCIDSRLNDYLCEMKPDYDDSITGFNEAWDIVRKAFVDYLPPPPLNPGGDLESKQNK